MRVKEIYNQLLNMGYTKKESRKTTICIYKLNTTDEMHYHILRALMPATQKLSDLNIKYSLFDILRTYINIVAGFVKKIICNIFEHKWEEIDIINKQCKRCGSYTTYNTKRE